MPLVRLGPYDINQSGGAMTRYQKPAHGIDTRQKVACAKCGNKFPRRSKRTDYCFKCARIEKRLNPDFDVETPLDEIGEAVE